jgi:uncharacterized protein (DUF2141 family)
VRYFLPIVILLYACASVTSPTGGPKDETPPELEFSNPEHNQKNFKGGSLELTFSELIKLKDPKEEILITPSPGKDTKFIANKNKLIIEPQNPWQENTTYSISFRDGVQDLNEGNPAENLRLAFSTGPVIDSLTISGSVKETFSEKPPDKITVALYQSDTFNIYNHMPTYFTKCNKEGVYSIQNLKPGTYYIYAFDDKNKNLKVDSKTEKFGFNTQPISLAENSDSTLVSLIAVDARPIKLTTVRHTEKTSRVRFNKGLDSINVASPKLFPYTLGDGPNEIIFYHNLSTLDSIMTRLIAIDSLGQTTDTTIYIQRTDTKIATESFSIKEVSENYNQTKRIYTHKLAFNKPILAILLDSIYIRYDSATIKPILANNITIDTIRKTILLQTDYIPNDTSKAKKPITLNYTKGAFISNEQDSSKRIIKEIKFLKEDETGLVSVKVATSETHFILQLVTTDDKIADEIKNVKDHTFKFVKAQEYKFRYIIDRNKNGKWDPGNFATKVQPEEVYYYKSEEGKYTFPIRANWEYGPLQIRF